MDPSLMTDEDTSKYDHGGSSFMVLIKVKDRSRATDYLSVPTELNKVQMHIYPITTSKKPVVKVIIMSSRCLHQLSPSVIPSLPFTRRG